MPYTHLISVDELKALQASSAPLLVVDCSFDLADATKADAMFAEQHIAGAVQAHLDRDLSAKDPADAVNGGRHPLPKRELFAQTLQRLGVNQDTQVVAYDRNGANYCGRLWWMLKWAGHDAVAVLNGGLQAWVAAGGATESGPAAPRAPGNFQLGEPLRRLVHTDDIVAALGRPTQTLIDARGGPRYRGETEPLDPVAGHIPGALNRPFGDNLGADGFFKPAAQLKQEFDALLAGRDAAGAVHHCGSGVSAVPNVLAMELAGYAPAGLYAGSWSEWSRRPELPVARG
ncbi:sulfurtransferase [Ottowia sp. GY511]|uniref:Sulfurtransferase n=1 Tax=Ottowia flava TaxID=2675430 RepID=A0ABW4KPF0_9BURK|nr:sulfurtransferase [Ottowia sp. GY511]TXK24686.1 sulfurtransferase [Ottowia sp. GY511]